MGEYYSGLGFRVLGFRVWGYSGSPFGAMPLLIATPPGSLDLLGLGALGRLLGLG